MKTLPEIEFVITCNLDAGNGFQQYNVWDLNTMNLTAVVAQDGHDGNISAAIVI